jgi:hypothetical protein
MKQDELLSMLDGILSYSERLEGGDPETSTMRRVLAARKADASFWSAVARERGGLREVFIPYALYVIVVPALIGSLSTALLWGSIMAFAAGAPSQFNLVHSIISAFSASITSIVGTLVVGKIVQIAAPSFGLRGSWVLSCRLLIYGFTPSYIAQAFGGIPFIGILMQTASFIYSLLLVMRGYRIVLRKEEPAKEPTVKAVESVEAEKELITA